MDKYVGKRLDGRYEIKEIIGIGGMAVVYKAYDTIDDREVAVKVLKEELLDNEEFRRRFKNESKAIAVMSHPNVVKVFDVSLGDRLQYIVMEHIDGITLKEYIERQKVIRWKDALHFVTQMLKALQHAHDKGIVHRDIKPQNIMLLQDGTIKVTDFGIAKFSRSEHRTITDKAIGSVHYISPEQARGEITDEKSDIYSVGVLLYEMLTGRLPFDAESAVSVAIMQLQNDPIKPRSINSSIPEGLEEITLHAMQKEPSVRYQSAAEMLKDIEKFKNNPSIQFEYKYFVDQEPTRYVSEGKDDAVQVKESENTSKPPIVPILLGIAAAFVICLGILGMVLLGRMFNIGPFAPKPSTELPCPKLIGQKYESVIKDAQYKDYKIIKGDDKYSNEYEQGTIISQSPEEGKILKGDHEITVIVSMGQKSTKMLNFANKKLDEAKKHLKDLGVEESNIKILEVYSDETSAGYIVRTTPAAGEDIGSGSSVVIEVSKGVAPINIKIGDYVAMKEDDAKRRIEGDGFTLAGIRYEASATYGAGYVINQTIPPKTDGKKGDPITLVVSSGRKSAIKFTAPDNAQKEFAATLVYGDKVVATVNSGASPAGKEFIIDVTPEILGITKADVIANPANKGWEVMLKYAGQDYIKYRVDFQTGTVTIIEQKQLPDSVLGSDTQAPEESSQSESSQQTNQQ